MACRSRRKKARGKKKKKKKRRCTDPQQTPPRQVGPVQAGGHDSFGQAPGRGPAASEGRRPPSRALDCVGPATHQPRNPKTLRGQGTQHCASRGHLRGKAAAQGGPQCQAKGPDRTGKTTQPHREAPKAAVKQGGNMRRTWPQRGAAQNNSSNQAHWRSGMVRMACNRLSCLARS